MATPSPDGLLGELHVLLDTTITWAQQLTNDPVWDTPGAHNPAGKELAAQEARRPEPQTGSWPWLLAPVIANWALQVAAQEAEALATLLVAHGATSYAADVLGRAVLEASSLAWWLLDLDIDAPTRLARSLVYRLHSADHTQRAIKALGLEPGERPPHTGSCPMLSSGTSQPQD